MAGKLDVQLNTLMDQDMADRLRAIAKRDDVSVGRVIRECVAIAIAERERVDQAPHRVLVNS